MHALSVDDYRQRANNQRMNLGEIGKRVRVRRVELRMTQEELAAKAEVGLGTVQALEDAPNRKNPRQTLPDNLQKIAKALKCSLDDLIKDKTTIDRGDPLLIGLNDEDLVIARGFHDATTALRQRVSALLRNSESDEVSGFVNRVLRLGADDFKAIDGMLSTLEARRSVPPGAAVTASEKK